MLIFEGKVVDSRRILCCLVFHGLPFMPFMYLWAMELVFLGYLLRWLVPLIIVSNRFNSSINQHLIFAAFSIIDLCVYYIFSWNTYEPCFLVQI